MYNRITFWVTFFFVSPSLTKHLFLFISSCFMRVLFCLLRVFKMERENDFSRCFLVFCVLFVICKTGFNHSKLTTDSRLEYKKGKLETLSKRIPNEDKTFPINTKGLHMFWTGERVQYWKHFMFIIHFNCSCCISTKWSHLAALSEVDIQEDDIFTGIAS